MSSLSPRCLSRPSWTHFERFQDTLKDVPGHISSFLNTLIDVPRHTWVFLDTHRDVPGHTWRFLDTLYNAPGHTLQYHGLGFGVWGVRTQVVSGRGGRGCVRSRPRAYHVFPGHKLDTHCLSWTHVVLPTHTSRCSWTHLVCGTQMCSLSPRCSPRV